MFFSTVHIRVPRHIYALLALAATAITAIACGDTMSGQEVTEPDTVDSRVATSPARPEQPAGPSHALDTSPPDPMAAEPAPDDAAQGPDAHVEFAAASKVAAPAAPAAQTPSAPATQQMHEPVAQNPGDAASAKDAWPEDCEQHAVLRAHGVSRAGDTTSYKVAAGSEHMAQFYFKLPWDHDVQLLKSVFTWDNKNVAHHWALYSMSDLQVDEGEVFSGTNLTDALRVGDKQSIIAAGRGSPDLELPEDVGLRLPYGPNVGLLLEVHYFNSDSVDAEDHSQLELCVTSKPRPIEAAVHSLGRADFDLPAHQQTDIVGTCAPSAVSEPIHIFALTPHMHTRGRHAKVELVRQAGERLTLVDQPFDASEQHTYRVSGSEAHADVVLEAGDSIKSTCTYENTTDANISSGVTVEDEMCTILAVAWPAGLLHKSVDHTRLFGVPLDTDCVEGEER